MSVHDLSNIVLNLKSNRIPNSVFTMQGKEVTLSETSESDPNSEAKVLLCSGILANAVETENFNLKSKFNVICRFCLNENEYMLRLQDIDTLVLEMITSLTKIQIDFDDCLPKLICTNCFETIANFFAFKQRIEEADKTLRSCLVLEDCHTEVQDDSEENCQSICDGAVAKEGTNEDRSERWENIGMFDELIEEDYDPNYTMVYETDPVVYSDCETDDETSLADNNLQTPVTQTGSLSSNEYKSESLENQEESVKCKICNLEFNDEILLSEHKKTHDTKKRKNICPICRKSFSHSSNLQCHMASHRSEDKGKSQNDFKCTKCNASFTVEKDLFIHQSIHADNDKFQCRECLKEFPNLSKLKRHVKTHYEDKPIKCEECGRGFPEMASLTRHYRIHTNEPRDRKHVCKECGKAYFDSHSLAIHVRTHTGEKPWACTQCGKRFIDSRLLNSHMRTHMSIRIHACNICDKSFTHRSTLVSHMRTHTGEKPFVCNICNKSFIQSSNLMLHMRVHSGEKPYQCSRCPKAFGSSSTLSLHLRTHTGEKPYSCKLCGKKFARHNLTIHMRTHTGEKPYDCMDCSRKFTTSSQLAQHRRTHTGDKPYSCEICDKKWTTHFNMKKHMQTHLTNNKPKVKEKNDEVRVETAIQEKNDPYDQQKHRIRIEEIQCDAEFNENAILVNDLLASVVNVNPDVLQSGNVEIPELSSYDSNPDLGEFKNVINSSQFQSSRTNETGGERVFVTEA